MSNQPAVQAHRKLDLKISRELNRELTEEFPWAGTHIAWHTIDGTARLDWGRASDEVASRFVRTLSIAKCPEVAILVSAEEPAAVYPLMYFLRHLDTVAQAREQYFAFGVLGNDIVRARPAEFATGRTIWGFTDAA